MTPTQKVEHLAKRLTDLLEQYYLPYSDEVDLHNQFISLFTVVGIEAEHEKVFGRSRLDFYMAKQRIAIEIKCKRQGIDTILSQMKKYNEIAEVDGVILICVKPFVIPANLSGKPVAIVPMWKQSFV